MQKYYKILLRFVFMWSTVVLSKLSPIGKTAEDASLRQCGESPLNDMANVEQSQAKHSKASTVIWI